jgi:hypothetical protein
MYGTGNPVTKKKLAMIRQLDFFVVKQLSGSHQAVIAFKFGHSYLVQPLRLQAF